MTLITCPTCKGIGFVEDKEALFDDPEDRMVECKNCGASGYVEKLNIIPF